MADLLHALTLVAVSLLFVIWRLEVRRRKRTFSLWVEASQVARQFPVGARIWYEYPKGYCRRCGFGTVVKRKRFRAVAIEGGTVVREVTGTYKCSGCSYRGYDLKQFSD